MSPLLAPILAQLIGLRLGDRTEARYVALDSQDKRYEGSTSPSAALNVSAGRNDFSLSYGPRLTLTPLERQPRYLLVFHQVATTYAYRVRLSTLTLTSSLGIGDINFRLLALQGQNLQPSANQGGNADPTNPTGQAGGATQTPTTTGDATGNVGAGASQPKIQDVNLRYYASSTTLAFGHRPLKDLDLGAQAGYTAAGGLDEEGRKSYTDLRGVSLGARATYSLRLTKRETFATNLAFTQTWSSAGNQTSTLLGQETWQHTFDPRTLGTLGAGLSITRFAQSDGLEGFSVFPTFQLTVSRQQPVGKGAIALAVFAYSAPALDPLRALVDPRIGGGASLAYTRDRFVISVTGGAALSLAPVEQQEGALNSARAEAHVGYGFNDTVSLDAGVRYARQGYQGQTVLGDTYAGFIALTLGADFQLSGNRRR